MSTEWSSHLQVSHLVSSSPTSSYPLVRHLPHGQTVPLLPSPVQLTSVISVSNFQDCQKYNKSELEDFWLYIIISLPFLSFSICPFVGMCRLRGRWTQCLTSLGFQDLQLGDQAVVHPPRLDIVCTLRPRWWDQSIPSLFSIVGTFLWSLHYITLLVCCVSCSGWRQL